MLEFVVCDVCDRVLCPIRGEDGIEACAEMIIAGTCVGVTWDTNHPGDDDTWENDICDYCEITGDCQDIIFNKGGCLKYNKKKDIEYLRYCIDNECNLYRNREIENNE